MIELEDVVRGIGEYSLPAEEEEIGTGAERRDNNENVFISVAAGGTTRNHQ